MNHLGGRAASVLTGLATAIVIVAVTIIPFLSPQWVAFDQGRAQAAAWTGYTTDELRVATDAIVADLVFGGDFTVQVNGQPVLNERERAHMARRPLRLPRAVDPRRGLGRRPGRCQPARGSPGDVASGPRRCDRSVDRRRDRRCRRVLRLRPALRGLPRGLLPAGLVPLRPGHGPARPALPVRVLGRDGDGRRCRDPRRVRRRGGRGGTSRGRHTSAVASGPDLAAVPEPGS